MLWRKLIDKKSQNLKHCYKKYSKIYIGTCLPLTFVYVSQAEDFSIYNKASNKTGITREFCA